MKRSKRVTLAFHRHPTATQRAKLEAAIGLDEGELERLFDIVVDPKDVETLLQARRIPNSAVVCFGRGVASKLGIEGAVLYQWYGKVWRSPKLNYVGAIVCLPAVSARISKEATSVLRMVGKLTQAGRLVLHRDELGVLYNRRVYVGTQIVSVKSRAPDRLLELAGEIIESDTGLFPLA